MLVTSNTPPGVDSFKETLAWSYASEFNFAKYFSNAIVSGLGVSSLSFYDSMNIYRSAGRKLGRIKIILALYKNI